MGYVYILVNKYLPGLINIGKTHGLPSERAKHLSLQIGIQSPFEVASAVRCDRPEELEQDMLREFDEYRYPGQEFYPDQEFFEYDVGNAIWALEKFHFMYMSIDDAISLLETLHFNTEEMDEYLPQNNHPWNQHAKELLLQLPDDEIEYYSQLPYNQVNSGELYILQLIDWGLSGKNEEMLKLLESERKYINSINLYGPSNILSYLEFDLTPKQAMLYLMAEPGEHPEEAIPLYMNDFYMADHPAKATMFLLLALNHKEEWRTGPRMPWW